MANGQDSANALDAVYGVPSTANALDAVYGQPKSTALDSVYAPAATQPQPTFHQWRLNNKRILPTTPEEQDAEGNPTYASVPSQSQAPAPSDTGIIAGLRRNTVGMASGLYHAFTDPATDQEKADLLANLRQTNAERGDNAPEDLATNPSQATLVTHRLLTHPADLLNARSDQQLQTAKNLWNSGAHWDAANLSVSGAANKVLSAIPIAGPMVNAIAERAEGSLVPAINEQGQRIAPENIPAYRKDFPGAATDVAALIAAENIPNFIKGKLAGARPAPAETAPTAPVAPATSADLIPTDRGGLGLDPAKYTGQPFTDEGLRSHLGIPDNVSLRGLEAQGKIVHNANGTWSPTPAFKGVPGIGTAGVPAEMAQRIAQNAEALKPIVDPEKIQTRADVGNQLDQAASVLQRNPDPRMAGPLSFAEQQRLAADLGMKPEDLLGSKPGQAFSAEQVVAARSMLEASTTRVMNAARMAATGDPAYQSQFLESLARHQEIQQTITDRVAAEAGRALGAFRNAPEGGTIQAAVDQLSKLDDAARLEAANRLAKLDPNDATAIAKFTREITPSSTAEKLYEAWMNGILSGGTAIVKGASDVAMRTLGIATRTVSPAVDFIRAALTGEPRERFFGEIPADLYGMTRGASKALAQFSDTFFHEKGMGEGPLDTGFRTAAIKGPLGTIVRTPTRALEAVTDAAKIVNYSADIHAQAYRQAATEGLNGANLLAQAEQIAAEPTPEMRAAAGQYGKEQTFQQKLGPIGKGVMDLRNKIPGGKYILPFIKTPANILKAAIDYSPAGVIKTGIKVATGKLTGGQLSDALAKNSLGTALAGAVIYNALQGNITGSGPASSNDRLRLESQGWQPYSIKAGNKFVSYRKLEPIGTVMGMAADVADAVKEAGPASGPQSGNLTKRLVAKIRTNLDSAEFIGSLMRITQLFESPEKYGRSMAGSVIPTAVADIAKATDRTVRTPDTNAPFLQQVQQQVESRIPGLTQNVPALMGPNRQPIERPASAVGGFNPYPATTAAPGLPATERALQIQQQRRQLIQTRQQLIKQQLKARGLR